MTVAGSFARLGARLRRAAAGAPAYREQLRSVAHAYVSFATSDANLVELMFAHKRGAGAGNVAESAADAFAPMLEMFRRGRGEGLLPAHEPERIGLIFVATLQGITGLSNCGVIPADQLDELIEDAVAQFPGASRSSA